MQDTELDKTKVTVSRVHEILKGLQKKKTLNPYTKKKITFTQTPKTLKESQSIEIKMK